MPSSLKKLGIYSWIGILVWLCAPSTLHAYQRILSLKPNITEILFALGMGENIVGATTYCHRPPAAAQIPRVADYIRVNPEKALSLKPDLMLASMENSSQKEVRFLESRGIPLVLLPFDTLEETLHSIEKMGDLLAKPQAARHLTDTMRAKLADLKKRSAAVPKKRALFVVGYQPLVVAGSGNFFDEAANYIGVENVAHESRLRYPTWSTEQLLRAQPEILWDISMDTTDPKQAFQTRMEFWNRFPSLPAVKSGQIHYFDIEKMRAVPGLPDAFAELYRMAHPLSPAGRTEPESPLN